MKMTATSNGFSFNMLVSLVCVALVLVGGWYFQSSLVVQKVKIEVQGEIIQKLKETVLEQRKLLNQLQVQLQILQNQPQVSI